MLSRIELILARFRSAELWIFIILFLHAEMLIWGAVANSPTVDEPRHISAGLIHWKTWEFWANRGNPPFVNMIATLPLIWRDVNPGSSGEEFMSSNGANAFWYIIYSRWACIPFSLLGGYICFRWASVLYGNASGILALILWCLCPDILANGQLATCDLAATSIGVTAGFVYSQWLRQRTWGWAVCAGLMLGAVQLTKYVWVVAYPLWLTVWCLCKLIEFRTATRASILRESGQIVTMIVISMYVINSAYGFEGSFSPIASYPMNVRILKYLGMNQSAASQSSIAQGIQSIPVPLPRQYWLGVDAVVAYNQEPSRQPYGIYLHGERKMGGWWYFYLYAMAVKLPLGFWVLLGLACFLPSAWSQYSSGWYNEMTLILSAVGIVVFVSSVTTAQFARYILPAYPFAFIWVSKLALAGGRSLLSKFVTLAAISFVTSSVSVLPHSLSYFNEFAGGPRNGHRHLVNASFDWGQDLFYLRDWLNKHAAGRPVRVAYFGLVDPKLVGIDASFTSEPSVGLNAISMTVMRSGYEPWSREFLNYEPVAMAGYSIYIYDIDSETAAAIRQSALDSQ